MIYIIFVCISMVKMLYNGELLHILSQFMFTDTNLLTLAIVRVLIPQKSANAVSQSLIDFHVDYFGLKR